MTQKILGGHAEGHALGGELVRAKVDQVVLTGDPEPVLAEALRGGMKRAAVETAVAYDTRCVGVGPQASSRVPLLRDLLRYNVLVARPGIGFPVAVHLERFASPGRIVLTDESRCAALGGAGTLTVLSGAAALGEAMTTGWTTIRVPRTVQVLLSGKLRPFVSVRDVALELMRQGLGDLIGSLSLRHRAPVVLEFAGPSVRLLSVYDRAVLASVAPRVGAATSLFVSDEKAEVFLRDQRRSKAHRALAPDAGAPCDEVVSLDVSAIDPLIMDDQGKIHGVRQLQGTPVLQAILGGDHGASLRELLSAALLLKSKKVPPRLDLLVAPPSRQALEVLARSGALVDLIATGARLLEPDSRLITGELYPPCTDGLSLRTFDPEPGATGSIGAAVASADTVAYAVACGHLGDPRSFKRPVRVTVPRNLPTDDVLLLRRSKAKARARQEQEPERPPARLCPRHSWRRAITLRSSRPNGPLTGPSLVVLGNWQQTRWALREAPRLLPELRAIAAAYIPAHAVTFLSSYGILALAADEDTLRRLGSGAEVALPSTDRWAEDGTVNATVGSTSVALQWLAQGADRESALGETAHTGAAGGRPAAR
jgi:aconitate hydratase